MPSAALDFGIGRERGDENGKRGLRGERLSIYTQGMRHKTGREMGVISEAALPVYSFIIQSNVCLSPMAFIVLSPCLVVYPLLTSQNQTNLNLSSMQPHSTKSIVFPIPFQFHSVVAAQL